MTGTGSSPPSAQAGPPAHCHLRDLRRAPAAPGQPAGAGQHAARAGPAGEPAARGAQPAGGHLGRRGRSGRRSRTGPSRSPGPDSRCRWTRWRPAAGPPRSCPPPGWRLRCWRCSAAGPCSRRAPCTTRRPRSVPRWLRRAVGAGRTRGEHAHAVARRAQEGPRQAHRRRTRHGNRVLPGRGRRSPGRRPSPSFTRPRPSPPSPGTLARRPRRPAATPAVDLAPARPRRRRPTTTPPTSGSNGGLLRTIIGLL